MITKTSTDIRKLNITLKDNVKKREMTQNLASSFWLIKKLQ